jgi:hypothetical protein
MRRSRPKPRAAQPYGKLTSSARIGGTTHYKDPDVLRRVPIPNGGELRLEALSPYGGGEPIIRWVAEYHAAGALCTTESYLQIPHHGYDILEQPAAARIIEDDCRRIIEKIKRERLTAARAT